MDTGLCKYKEGKSFLPDASSPSLFFLLFILLLWINEYKDGRVEESL